MVRIHLVRAFSVSGEIIDAAGKPLPKGGVRIEPVPGKAGSDEGGSDGGYGDANSRGRFYVGNLPPARYRVTASAPGFEDSSTEVDVARDERGLRFVLKKAAAKKR